MRLLILIAGAALAMPALADDAYVFPTDDMRVGEVTHLKFPTILYTARKCDLPVSEAALMRFYASYNGKWDTGCWTRNVAGEAVILVPHKPIRKIPLESFARADVRHDGSAYIKALPGGKK
jgi:hypothetical protein